MARVPYLDDSELDEPARSVLAGHPINLNRALANAPDALLLWHQVGMWIRWHLTLPPRLRELAILQVGVCSRSEYEVSHHVKIGLDFGLLPVDIRSLIGSAQLTDPGKATLELCTLNAARQLTSTGAIDDETWAALQRELRDQQLVELVVTIAFYACVVRVLSALQVDVEPNYRSFLRDFPLPT